MNFLKKKNNAKSTLNESISDTDLSIIVADSSVFPDSGNFLLTIWNKTLNIDPSDDLTMEIVKVTSVETGNTLIIQRAQEGTIAQNHELNDAVALFLTAGTLEELENSINDLESSSIQVIFDGGDSVLSTGIQLDIVVPFDCVINSVELLAAQTGSIVFDIWKNIYANFPPTNIDTIINTGAGGIKPGISNDVKSQPSINNWSTSLSIGDVLRFNIDSISSIKKCNLILSVTRT